MMEKTRQTRNNFVALVDGLSHQDLNTLVPGFQNTIAWNLGHIVVSQQKLCYAPANVPFKVSEKYLQLFQKGTKTIRDITPEEIKDLKRLAFTLIDEMDSDIKAGRLDKYKPLQTHFGLLLTTIQQAADFSALHDSMHLGYIQAQRRAIEGLKAQSTIQS
jgi:hypothetical protein